MPAGGWDDQSNPAWRETIVLLPEMPTMIVSLPGLPCLPGLPGRLCKVNRVESACT